MKTLLLFLLTAWVIPAELAAQPEPKTRAPIASVTAPRDAPPPVNRMRIAGRAYVGEAAPGFELSDANDRPVKLSKYRGDRLLLAFADRGQELAGFRAVSETLRTDGVRLVGVCRESSRRLRMLLERESLPFDLLSDLTGEVSALYGAYDFTTSTTQPGYVLVGKQGTVRMVVLGQSLPPGDLLQITRYALTGLEQTP
jgi:peroxiredoxin